jgi:hypothetical protein
LLRELRTRRLGDVLGDSAEQIDHVDDVEPERVPPVRLACSDVEPDAARQATGSLRVANEALRH